MSHAPQPSANEDRSVLPARSPRIDEQTVTTMRSRQTTHVRDCVHPRGLDRPSRPNRYARRRVEQSPADRCACAAVILGFDPDSIAISDSRIRRRPRVPVDDRFARKVCTRCSRRRATGSATRARNASIGSGSSSSSVTPSRAAFQPRSDHLAESSFRPVRRRLFPAFLIVETHRPRTRPFDK